jgi:hypothetical protein
VASDAEVHELRERIGLLEYQVSRFAALSAQIIGGRWTGRIPQANCLSRRLSRWHCSSGRRPPTRSDSSQFLSGAAPDPHESRPIVTEGLLVLPPGLTGCASRCVAFGGQSRDGNMPCIAIQ